MKKKVAMLELKRLVSIKKRGLVVNIEYMIIFCLLLKFNTIIIKGLLSRLQEDCLSCVEALFSSFLGS